MTVTVRFSDKDGGAPLEVHCHYSHGDHKLIALNIDCVAVARRHGQNYIKYLEKERKKK